MKVAAPVYLDWSDKPITFDQGDHPDHVPSLGKYPLVVDPVIGNIRLTKVLMDGGSSLNIIYAETLGLLQIDLSTIRAGAARLRTKPKKVPACHRPCHRQRKALQGPHGRRQQPQHHLRETLGLLQIDQSSIRAGAAPFHGIIPGKRVQPLGQLDLPVCFGTPSNFQKETLTFEVDGF